eukprot:m.26020 g.26020  ORF g.26020 m.26020 type:complete len:255 (-) comp11653_c0_seq1:813-1577(-)
MATRAKVAKTADERANVSTDSEVEPDADGVLVRRRKRPVRRKDPYRYDIEPDYKAFRSQIYKRDLKALEDELLQLQEDRHPDLKRWQEELTAERDRQVKVAEAVYDHKVQNILDLHITECKEVKKRKDHKIASLRRNLRAQLEAEKAKLSTDLVNLSWVVKNDLIGDQGATTAAVERNARTTRAAEKAAPKRRRKPAHNATTFRLQPHQFLLKDWEVHDDFKSFASNQTSSRQTTTRGAMTKMEERAKTQDGQE